jgi:hypothetical protein
MLEKVEPARAFAGVLSAGSAMKIPLSDVSGFGLANLRSAVHRAANARGLKIETLADEKTFYLWNWKSDAKSTEL